MKYLVSLMLLIPLIACSQKNNVRFVEGLSWEQIIEKAKAENKNIFVDCYTTWCGPCKWMEKEVFALDTVGDYMNERFISVKLQFDSTHKDDLDVKNKYQLAAEMKTLYNVREYPTYLFFGSSGEPLHKSTGTFSKNDFIKLCNQAMDTSAQYYTLLNAYIRGRKDYRLMQYLAVTAKKLNENKIARVIARDYINYLSEINEDEFIEKSNIEFISMFKDTISTNEKTFKLLFQRSNKIDSLMGKDFSKGTIDYIISMEELTPSFVAYMKCGQIPNWNRIKANIKNKYAGEYADRIVTNAKVMHYKYTKEWKSYAENLVKKISKYGVGNVKPKSLKWWFLNNYAFEVFLYSNSKKELKVALDWINDVINIDSFPVAAHLDTKANLLYKLGRKKEAIELEGKALSLALNDKDIKETFEKMNKGLPTWPQN